MEDRPSDIKPRMAHARTHTADEEEEEDDDDEDDDDEMMAGEEWNLRELNRAGWVFC